MLQLRHPEHYRRRGRYDLDAILMSAVFICGKAVVLHRISKPINNAGPQNCFSSRVKAKTLFSLSSGIRAS